MEIFVHTAESTEPAIVEVDVTLPIGQLTDGDTDVLIWIEDTDDPVDPTINVSELEVKEHTHVHKHRCHRVSVTVNFGDKTRPHEFSPATTIARVTDWAVGPHGFDLPADQRPKHRLVICGTDTVAERSHHLGSYTKPGDCSVCFDLTSKHNYQG